MTHVVVEACKGCKNKQCVDVCPVDCFHEGPDSLVIDPTVCIDCSLCVEKCPVHAIVIDEEVAMQEIHFIARNAELSQQWPRIRVRQVLAADTEPLYQKPEKSEPMKRPAQYDSLTRAWHVRQIIQAGPKFYCTVCGQRYDIDNLEFCVECMDSQCAACLRTTTDHLGLSPGTEVACQCGQPLRHIDRWIQEARKEHPDVFQ